MNNNAMLNNLKQQAIPNKLESGGHLKMKEVDDINMHIFNLKEDNLNDIDFDDRMNVDDKFQTRK
jgi:hypothetical protein